MKKHLVLAAMDSEFKDLVESQDFSERKLIHSTNSVWEKSFSSAHVVIAKTGVGPINAAISLTKLLDESNYDEVILLGLGGAVDARLDVGDLVVASGVIQHDALCSFDDRTEYMACGELHLSIKPSERKDILMASSADLNSKYGSYLKSKGFRVFEGAIGSGSEFVGSLNKKNEIKKNLETVVMVDMEACSIAYICIKQQIKFTVIKTVADTVKADVVGQYRDYMRSSAKKCAEIITFIGN